MIQTKHFIKRMRQRGITSEMINLVYEHGRIEDDKLILDKKETNKLIKEMNGRRSNLLKIMDKGGIVVVAEEAIFITTYNKESYKRGKV